MIEQTGSLKEINSKAIVVKKSKIKAFMSYVKAHWPLYAMILPGFACLLIFSYAPMVGVTLAFKDYNPTLGILDSPWSSSFFQNFKYVLSGYGFFKLVRNTLFLGLLNLIFAFPSSIILALMFNELRNKTFKKAAQTVSYLPYFISWVVISGMAFSLFSVDTGLFNKLLESVGLQGVFWYNEPSYWPWILTFAGIWKSVGWGTIVFLAGISAIDTEIYEAAKVDGAGRWRQTLNVTIPGIMPVICITFILTITNIVKDDFEKIYALVGSSSQLFETTDVLGTWVYRTMKASFTSYGEVTAVTLMQSVISLILMIGANWIVKKSGNQPLW